MQWQISDQEISRLAIEITRSLIKKSRPSPDPTAILVGGQPAAGKTGLISSIKQSESQRDFIEINGDDLRSWHPHYWALLRQNDTLAADHTQKAVNFWVESLINAAIRHRRNIIIEGTMRNPAVPLRTSSLLKQNAYRVGLYVMAIPFWQSEVRIFERYERQKAQMGYGRFSNLATHRQAFDSFPDALAAVLESGNIDFIKAFGRDMNGIRLVCEHTGPLNPDQQRELLGTIQKPRLQLITVIELMEYENVWADVLHKMRLREARAEEIETVLQVKAQSLATYAASPQTHPPR